MIGGTFPSITAAQVVAFAAAIIGVLVSFGVDISDDQQQSLLILIGIVSSALIVGDAALRASRNSRAGRENAAAGMVTPELGEPAVATTQPPKR